MYGLPRSTTSSSTGGIAGSMAQQQLLSYAPLPSTSSAATANLHPNATIPLDAELKAFSSAADRDLLDSLAELYSIIRTLDGLEKAYQKDALAEHEYAEMAGKLLKQYRSLLGDERVSREFGSLEEFVAKWEVDAPRAIETLRVGLTRDEVYRLSNPNVQNLAMGNTGGVGGPGHGGSGSPGPGLSGGHLSSQNTGVGMGSSNQPSATAILNATENFITFLDALRLNMLSKSALHPLLSDVIQSVNKVTNEDFEGRAKIIQWLITLNGLKASEELSDEMARECAFDIEGAYGGFKIVIGGT